MKLAFELVINNGFTYEQSKTAVELMANKCTNKELQVIYNGNQEYLKTNPKEMLKLLTNPKEWVKS